MMQKALFVSAAIALLSGEPVRLRVQLKDADLYSFQFTAAN